MATVGAIYYRAVEVMLIFVRKAMLSECVPYNGLNSSH